MHTHSDHPDREPARLIDAGATTKPEVFSIGNPTRMSMCDSPLAMRFPVKSEGNCSLSDALLLVAALAQRDRTFLRGGPHRVHGRNGARVCAAEVLGAAEDQARGAPRVIEWKAGSVGSSAPTTHH